MNVQAHGLQRLLRPISILILLIISAIAVSAQTPQWQDLYHVKKKDTLYGIAKKYGITIEELQQANPATTAPDFQLKKGDQLLIPFHKEATTTAPAQPTATQSKKVTDGTLRIGVMLPLHNVDGDGRRMTEYYRGLLIACDSLSRQGIRTQVSAWNVNIDADIRQTLLAEEAPKCDIIFGPLYTKQVKPLADFCRTYGIKLVIPFSINGNDVATNAQIFQVYQSPDQLNEAAIRAYLDRFPNAHAVFIDCNDTTSRKGPFTFGLRKRLEERGIQYNITNLKSSEENFKKSFSRDQLNVVILNTGRSPELNVALAKIDGLRSANPNIRISLFGYTEWLMYTKAYLEYFHKYDAYIPTTFFYNPLSARTKGLETAYRKWFKQDMRQSLPRFAITGYDHGRYFLEGLHRHGAAFTGTPAQSSYNSMQTPLRFEHLSGGGMQNRSFMLMHYKTDHSISAINY